ncbi:MAG: hypothetical protein WC676_02835 [Candidatus Omnitrophota bacterium]
MKILLVVGYLCIFGILLNYENAWMHNEVAVTTQKFFDGHPSFLERVSQCLNWQIFEGEYGGVPNSRARIFSNIFQTFNILFRNWIFQFIPVHPSLSLTWIVVLVLCPYFLYKFIKNITDDKAIALITAFLYIISPGALISVIMLFLPGKAITNFFCIFCLYLGSVIARNIEKASCTSFRRDFLFLVLMIIASLFFDEYSLFIFVLVPIFFPGIFRQRQQRVFTTILYLLIPAVYYFSLTFFLPQLYAFAGYPGFNFFAFSDHMGISQRLPNIDVWAMIVNFILLLHDNLLAGFNAYLKDPSVSVRVTQFYSTANELIHGDNIQLGWDFIKDKHITFFQILHGIFSFAILAVGAWALAGKWRDNQNKKLRTYFLKSLMALVGFVIFFSLLHMTSNILAGCGYYGSCFSVFFAITVGLGLKFMMDKTPWKNVLICIFLASLMVNSFYNIRMLNYSWIALHYRQRYWELSMWLNQYPLREIYEKHFVKANSSNLEYPYNLKNNFKITYEAWRNRKDPGICKMIISAAPPELRGFLLAELPYIK